MVKTCHTCQEHQSSQTKEPLLPLEVPKVLWTKIVSDLFTLDGKDYLLVVDYSSKYPITRRLNNTRRETVTAGMSEIFSLFGPPIELVSDDGPQYTGAPFKQMIDKWAITHTTSSPRYPRSNGLAERTVRTVKALLKKCKQSNQDVHIAMLHLSATPVDSKLPSPAQMLFGRPIRTNIRSYHHPSPIQKQAEIGDHHREKTAKMEADHEKQAGAELPILYKGHKVRVMDQNDHTWQPATISKVCAEPRSYEITRPNGPTYRRKRSQIREINSKPQPKRVRFAKEVGNQDNQKQENHKYDPAPDKRQNSKGRKL